MRLLGCTLLPLVVEGTRVSLAAGRFVYFYVLLFIMMNISLVNWINYIRFLCDYDIRKHISCFSFRMPHWLYLLSRVVGGTRICQPRPVSRVLMFWMFFSGRYCWLMFRITCAFFWYMYMYNNCFCASWSNKLNSPIIAWTFELCFKLGYSCIEKCVLHWMHVLKMGLNCSFVI